MWSRRTCLAGLALSLLWFAGCRKAPVPAVEPQSSFLGAGEGVISASPLGLRAAAEGQGAAVASSHPLATAAALDAMSAGGNAVDAFVAASMMLTVVRPQSTGIGGGGFALVRTPDGAVRAYDYRETAPMDSRIEDYLDDAGEPVAERSRHHGLAVGVPGYVAGLWTLHQSYGLLPWSRLVEPAAVVAERGFPVGRHLAWAIDLVKEHLDEGARAVFLDDGRPRMEGDALVQPALARTLARIGAEGPDAFYRGAVAQDIVDTVRAAGGRLRREDLAGYRVRKVEPLRGSFFGHEVLTMPEPSAGGAQVLAMAEMMETWKLPEVLERGSSPGERAHYNAEAMRRSFLLRLAHSADTSEPSSRLDEAFPAAARAQLARSFQGHRASATAVLEPRLDTPASGHPNTSHLSIMDRSGMVVAATHTVNLLLGSAIVAPRSGVVLNNEMDDFSFKVNVANAFGLAGSSSNLIRPGARPVSSMSPTIVLDAAGRPALIVGTLGGTRIPTTVFQVMVGSLVEGVGLAEAVARPRVHHQALPDQVEIEEGEGGEALVEGLQARGHTIERKRPWCDVQAIGIDGGRVLAISDPRGEGAAGILE
jgi:gamma-glutamyltranspeptidase/glutathione hydrolase